MKTAERTCPPPVPWSVSRGSLTMGCLSAALCLACADPAPTVLVSTPDAPVGFPQADGSVSDLPEGVETSATCGDGTCVAGDENCGACPADCGCEADEICVDNLCVTQPVQPTCGDGQCAEETCATCPVDCPCEEGLACLDGGCVSVDPGPSCGDGQCAEETCATCPVDCPCGGGLACVDSQCVPLEPEPFCGDGICGDETCGTCPADCLCPTDEACVENECVVLEIPPSCGDDLCVPGEEDCGSCPGDCPCPDAQACVDGACVPAVPEPSCGDGLCAPGEEDCGTCLGDCPCPDAQVCVEHSCVDVEAGPSCGDGICQSEGCGTCLEDCACASEQVCVNDACVEAELLTGCGDGACAPGEEDCGTCPGDCPCPPDTVCENQQCVTPGSGETPDGESTCANEGWDCVGCASGESCVQGRCAPTVVLLTSPDTAPAFVCPSGMSLAGRWRTSLGAGGDTPTGTDAQGFQITAGWAYLCSANPGEVFISVQHNDCGPTSDICDGEDRGTFHVGSGCDGAGVQGVDAQGSGISAGWLKLCVKGAHQVKLEIREDDCGQLVPNGCGAWAGRGHWHTVPANCGGGGTGTGATGQQVTAGWMELCVDTDRYHGTDPSNLTGKSLFGYQGWFMVEGDGSGGTWNHWSAGTQLNASNAHFDLWPDTSEFDADELFDTGLSYSDGGTAQVFSSYKKKTVKRHFRWMAETGIDGVFLQRFLVDLKDPVHLAFRNQVTENVCAGATHHGRSFAIMYDISGASEATFIEDLKTDWAYLVNEMSVTDSPAYLKHNGKPVLGIWGLGFNGRPGTAEQALALIDYLHSGAPADQQAYVVGGVPYHWRTSDEDSKPGFLSVYTSYDTVSPWSVGRYGDNAAFDSNFNQTVISDKSFADAQGLGYAPVSWPGFSWANLQGTPGAFNQIPRNGGTFFWHQVRELHELDPLFLYVAMFDEVDESTAMFKAATHGSEVPAQGQWLHLGQDGQTLPSDWYLRLGGASAKAMAGQFEPQSELPFTAP